MDGVTKELRRSSHCLVRWIGGAEGGGTENDGTRNFPKKRPSRVSGARGCSWKGTVSDLKQALFDHEHRILGTLPLNANSTWQPVHPTP